MFLMKNAYDQWKKCVKQFFEEGLVWLKSVIEMKQSLRLIPVLWVPCNAVTLGLWIL